MKGDAATLAYEVRLKRDAISFQTPTVGPVEEQLT